MKNEEIVKQLKYISTLWRNGCGGLGALDELIDTLSPKPLFVPGPAKLRNGWDAEIYKIFDDCIHGCYTRGNGSIMVYAWTDTGSYIKPREGKFMDLLPNNEPEEKYKCKKCGGEINKGEFDTFGVCDGCWDKPEEKVYGPQKCKDAADSKLNFGDKE